MAVGLYKPSWFDRFTDWIAQLSLPAWGVYFTLALALILVQLIFLGLDRGLAATELLPVIAFNGLFASFPLALIHFLDAKAVAAFRSMRPALNLTDTDFERHVYKLATMPTLPPLVAGLVLVAFLIVMESSGVSPLRYAALEELPVFAVVYQVIDKATAFLTGVFFYHTIRQLRLVNAINSGQIRVNLFELRPLQAFSGLTASTAVGLVIGIYGWMLINPDLLADPINIGFVGLFTALAVAVFVWPLVGAHRLIAGEKQRVLGELDAQFAAVFAQFNQHLREERYPAIERLNATIPSLEIQYRKVEEIPTWPWRAETVRTALTAIALPLVLTVLQYLIVRIME